MYNEIRERAYLEIFSLTNHGRYKDLPFLPFQNQLNHLYNDNYPERICWRVEATDTISMPGILEITAYEYYINE